MPGYAAFLRGVSPVNLPMPKLKRCMEAAGFTDVKTVLASGNVVFTAPSGPSASIAKKAEAAIQRGLGKPFLVLVRPIDALQKLLEADPYSAFRLPSGAKRVVTFLRSAPKSKPALPVELEGARILRLKGEEAYTAYEQGRGPVFMRLIQKTFGDAVTTRTWDTVRKVVSAYAASAGKKKTLLRGRDAVVGRK